MERNEARFLAAYQEWERAGDALYDMLTSQKNGEPVDPEQLALERQKVHQLYEEWLKVGKALE